MTEQPKKTSKGTYALVGILILVIACAGLQITKIVDFTKWIPTSIQGKIIISAKGGSSGAAIAVSVTVSNISKNTPATFDVDRFKAINVIVPTTVTISGTEYTFTQWNDGTTTATIQVMVTITDVEIVASYSSGGTPPPQTYLFTSGFENGKTGLTDYLLGSGSSTPAIVTSDYRTGTHSCYFATPSTIANGAGSNYYSTVTYSTSGSKTCVKLWLYVPQGVLNSMIAYDRFYPIEMVNTAEDYYIIGVRKQSATTPLRWYLGYTYINSTGSKITSGSYYTGYDITSIPKWTLLEMWVDQSTGTIQVWSTNPSGTLLNLFNKANLNQTGIDTISTVRMGIYRIGNTGYETPTHGLAVQTYMDDIIIDDSPIPTTTNSQTTTFSLVPSKSNTLEVPDSTP